MRRALILGGVWALGIVASVAFAFAAVARVAGGIAPHDVSRLSQTEIDDALKAPPAVRPTTAPTTAPTTRTTLVPTSTTPTVATTVTSPPPTTTAPRSAGETATTSQGGTLYARCTDDGTIDYAAAVPRMGYERVIDDESPGRIEEAFENDHHRSTIVATCEGGTVHAQVTEGRGDD